MRKQTKTRIARFLVAVIAIILSLGLLLSTLSWYM